MSDFSDRMQNARDKIYLKAGIAAAYLPISGSTPPSVSVTILLDEQEGSNDNMFENSAQSAVIWVRQSELSDIERPGETTDPVPNKEKLTFKNKTWRVTEILDDTGDEWKLLLDRDI